MTPHGACVTTLSARTVFEDCKASFENLKAVEREDISGWRVHWVATITLLRAIGHVLDKVDGATNDQAKAIIKGSWYRWHNEAKEHIIFHGFIDKERNNILKNYEFGAAPEPIYIVDNEGNKIGTNDGDLIVMQQEFFRLSLPDFKDRDGREVIQDAISWWDAELKIIEEKLSSS